jgi:hypothetical protein
LVGWVGHGGGGERCQRGAPILSEPPMPWGVQHHSLTMIHAHHAMAPTHTRPIVVRPIMGHPMMRRPHGIAPTAPQGVPLQDPLPWASLKGPCHG